MASRQPIDAWDDLLAQVHAEVEALKELVRSTDEFISKMSGPDNVRRLTERPRFGSGPLRDIRKPSQGVSRHNTP